MAVEFRCENCGELLSVDADDSRVVICQHCGKTSELPEELASLPKPILPGTPKSQGVQRAASADDISPLASLAVEVVEDNRVEDVFFGMMAGVMPWMISVFFHVGLGLILLFLTIIVTSQAREITVTVPGTVMQDKAVTAVKTTSKSESKMSEAMNHSKVAEEHKQEITEDDEDDESAVFMVEGDSAADDGLADFGLVRNEEELTKSSFMDMAGNAHNIVYLIDRSGSMLDSFNAVRDEIVRSIAMLKPVQNFDVVLFAEGEPLEKTPRGLVAATDGNKRRLAAFLEPIRAEKSTNPIKAISRAFAVLSQARRDKPGRIIYLLTDGNFPDNNAVIRLIRKLNARKQVKINTFLYGRAAPNMVAVMQKIAGENGGRFRLISEDE